MVKTLLSACVCLCLAAGTLCAQSDEVIATARKTLQTYEKAVVVVDAVFKLEIKGASGGGMEGREQKGEFNVTIVDPSGLAVTALTSASPKRNVNAGGHVLQVVGQLQEAKYHLPDGTEIPARVVLKDEDLDLAFLAPLKPLDEQTKAKITAISMSDAAPAPELLDRTIVVKRGGEHQDYVPMLDTGLITAILSKPRNCYNTNRMAPGNPAFDKQGKVFGIFVMLRETLPVLLPAADVAKLVPQALEEAKKPAAEEKKEKEE
jgi:hypothetical protein